MNKIVKSHYPASRLPEDLRGNIPSDSMVEIIVTEELAAPDMAKLRDLLEVAPRHRGARSGEPDEAVKRIRTLREEWDD